ncbi:MAG: hypothetical protein PHC53_04595 [Patescibacteria group bacterium]|nr:hypothetical protein [Patescibacteria group bacterium]
MLEVYQSFFEQYPPVGKELRELLERFQDLQDERTFLDTLLAIALIRPQAFEKELPPSPTNEAGLRQMEIFLCARPETKDVIPWIVGYQDAMREKTNRFAAAFHRPEMTERSVNFLYRCARRLMEDIRAEIGRKYRSKLIRDPHRLDGSDKSQESKD